jgi:hypothetical protein
MKRPELTSTGKGKNTKVLGMRLYTEKGYTLFGRVFYHLVRSQWINYPTKGG